jgi:hypothetical protein
VFPYCHAARRRLPCCRACARKPRASVCASPSRLLGRSLLLHFLLPLSFISSHCPPSSLRAEHCERLPAVGASPPRAIRSSRRPTPQLRSCLSLLAMSVPGPRRCRCRSSHDAIPKLLYRPCRSPEHSLARVWPSALPHLDAGAQAQVATPLLCYLAMATPPPLAELLELSPSPLAASPSAARGMHRTTAAPQRSRLPEQSSSLLRRAASPEQLGAAQRGQLVLAMALASGHASAKTS